MPNCLTTEQLDRLATDRLHDAERDECVQHVDLCSRCRGALDRVERETDLFGALRGAAKSATPTSAGRPPRALLLADLFEGYRLLSEIHRGPHGGVYLAEDCDTGRQVAIKVLFGEPWSGTRDRFRFQREIQLAMVLDQPDIVPVEDSGEVDGLSYFVMPFVDGRHLDDYAQTCGPDLRTRLALFARICRAVAYAHQRGVIHRDLKPANILVDAAGSPRVLDFGLARPVRHERDKAVTWTGQFLGTPAYASPEQVCGTPSDITTSSDIYSLGVILYELVTGSMPYDVDASLGHVIENIRKVEPRPPSTVDFALRALMLKTLEKEPGRRYASAEALAADVERYLAGEPIDVEAAPWWYLLRRAVRRQRRAMTIHALVLAGCVAAVASFLALHFRAESQRTTAQQIETVLHELISTPAPNRMGGSVTVVDLLGDVSQRVTDTLQDAPDVQAAMQFAIGETYLRLLRPDDARGHLEAALTRFRAIDGDPPMEVARTLRLLGMVLAYQGEKQAVAMASEALAICERAPQRPRELAACRRTLGFALTNVGGERRHDAEPHLTAALAFYRDADGPESLEVARTLHRLALYHWRDDELERASHRFSQALTVFDRPDHRRGAWAVECMNDFAGCLQKQRLYDRAEKLLTSSIELSTTLFGEHRRVDILRQFSRLNRYKGDFANAEHFGLCALSEELQQWSRREPQDLERLTALHVRVLDGFATAAGRVAVLEGFCQLRDYHGRGAYEVARWLGEMAELAVLREMPEFAELLLREALDFDCRIYGADCPIRLHALDEMAEVLCVLERHDKAREFRDQAAAHRERTGAPAPEKPGGCCADPERKGGR